MSDRPVTGRFPSPWSAAGRRLDAEQALNIAEAKLAIYESLDQVRYSGIPKYTGKQGNAVAVALLSDVHCEERVDPEDVPGTHNVYSPEICKARLDQYFQKVVLLTQAQRHLVKIDTLCLGMLGDIITGYLHDDQRESNWLSPLEATMFAEELIGSGLEYLLKYGNFSQIILPCTPGNHGRTTPKPRAKTSAETNLEWMMYHHIAKRWRHESRLKWHIAAGVHQYLNLNGTTVRFHHGDAINYGGGVGGLAIPLHKAIAQWNQVHRADLDCFGHWHQLRDYGHAISNGSVIGYNAYALRCKCPFERPKQAFFLVDQHHGKSLVADIWTDFTPEKSK